LEQPGTVLKVGRGTEIEFYQSVNAKPGTAGVPVVSIPDNIKSFFPKFYGVQVQFLRSAIPTSFVARAWTKT